MINWDQEGSGWLIVKSGRERRVGLGMRLKR
jgi:hypothetical protein